MRIGVSQAGIDALAQFAAEMRPGLVGVALADAFEDIYLDLMLTWLEGGEPQATVAGNYLWRRCRVGGLRWARDVLATCPELTVDVQARLLHDIDDFRNSWQEAQRRGADVERSYWKRFVYVGLGGDFADVLVVAEHLGRVGRWAAALDVMALYSRSNEATGDYGEAIARAFEGFIEAGGDDPEAPALASWDFKELFQILDANVEAVGLDRITRIQWYFFPVLGFEPPTTTLHRRLADEPAFFVEIVSLVYRPRADVHPGVPPEPDRDPQLAQNAYRLLDSWSVPPGLSSDRQFDPARCEAWITEATQLLASADRLTVGRHHIGQILTYTPGDDNGWPSKAFAAIIEQLDDDDIDRGVQLKIRNRRGVTSRGVTEGGGQERELAVTYRAQSARFIYTAPRVARILGEIAQQYEQEAREHDDNAERRRRGLDS